MSTSHSWGEDVGEEKKHPGAPPLPTQPPSPRLSQLGLRHLMALSVVVALLMAAILRAVQSGTEFDVVLAVVLSSIALFAIGAYLTNRLENWAGVGWVLISVGTILLTVAVARYLAILIAPVIIGAYMFAVQRRRAIEQDSLLWVLTIAADRKRPLNESLVVLAGQTAGVYRKRAYRLAECLESGMPLPESLEFVRKAVPVMAKVLVRVGNDSGRLADALRDAATMRASRPTAVQNFGAQIGYFYLVLLVLQVITAFILYWVMPKFEAIFMDFGVQLPSVTIGIIHITHILTSPYVAPFVIAACLTFVLYVPFAVAGYASLKVPFLDWLFIRRHSVLILRCLTLAVEGGLPVQATLVSLARWYPVDWIRVRLAGVLAAHERGTNWISALLMYRLINNTDATLLEAATRANNLPWALRELTESSERKLNYRLQAITQIFMTLALLGIGAIIGLFSVAYFYPLVILIQRLT